MADDQAPPPLEELFSQWPLDPAPGAPRARARPGPEAETLRLAAQNLLRAPDGQEFLYWLINLTGVFSPTFTGNNNTFYLEGRRAVGLEVYRLLMSADPNALQTIIDFQRRRDNRKRRQP